VTGPEAGTVVALPTWANGEGVEGEAVELMLPSRDGAPAKIRIWNHESRYLMQHVDGPPVSVCGEPLIMPIVVLDDGDEIATDAAAVRLEVPRPA
jgi:hypothetical protein